MADAPREAWITGIGIVSSLGEGADAHWQALLEGRVNVDAERFAPYVIHPLAPINLDTQIPKKGDQRQMEPWQRIGTHTRDSRPMSGREAVRTGWVAFAMPWAKCR